MLRPRSSYFITLTAATSIGLFAQIGLIAHLFSLLAPSLGAHLAGFVAGLTAACAIAGRTGLGWLLPARANRRRVAAANYTVQACGVLALLLANGTNVPLLLLDAVLFGGGIGNTTSLPPLGRRHHPHRLPTGHESKVCLRVRYQVTAQLHRKVRLESASAGCGLHPNDDARAPVVADVISHFRNKAIFGVSAVASGATT
jgi:hypothetical protein